MLIVMVVAGLLATIIMNDMAISRGERERLKSFYAAEAGIEWVKSKLSEAPGWCTDAPHSPSDDKRWLLSGAAGFTFQVGDNECKVVRELLKGRAYAIGFAGLDPDKAKAISVIRFDFSLSPLRQISWAEI